MKLIVNQAYENMGLQLDPDARADPRRADAQHAGRASVHRAGRPTRASGAATNERDAPFGDYSMAGAERRPDPDNVIEP